MSASIDRGARRRWRRVGGTLPFGEVPEALGRFKGDTRQAICGVTRILDWGGVVFYCGRIGCSHCRGQDNISRMHRALEGASGVAAPPPIPEFLAESMRQRRNNQ